MSGFKPADAALEGFRITRENPRAFGVWVGLSLAVSVLGIAVDLVMPASIRHGLDSINAQQTLTPAQFADAMVLASPVLIFALTFMSVMAAAVYRLIFRHDDEHFAYLRLGADQFRLMGLTIICFAIAVGLVVAVSMVIGIALAIISTAMPDVAAALQLPAAFLSLFIVGAIMVRLSLAPVATFAERRIVVFESWQLTRGHFWPLLGAYLLAICCFIVVFILTLVIFFTIAAAIVLASGGKIADVGDVMRPQDQSLTSYLRIGIIAYMVLGSVLSTLWNAVIAAPGAVAYAQLHGAPPNRPLTAQPEAG